MPEEDSDSDPVSFEAALEDVQRIVDELESGELALEESLKEYEKGIKRIRQCHEFLNRFQRKVELLVGFDEDGNPVTESLEDDEMTLQQKQKARGRRRTASASRQRNDLDSDAPGLF